MEPGWPRNPVVGPHHQIKAVGNRSHDLGAQVDRVIRGIGRLVPDRIGPGGIGLDLTFGPVDRTKDVPAFDNLGIG